MNISNKLLRHINSAWDLIRIYPHYNYIFIDNFMGFEYISSGFSQKTRGLIRNIYYYYILLQIPELDLKKKLNNF